MKKLSKKGYKKDSPDKNNPYNIIPGENITMNNVPHDVLGISMQTGQSQYMKPENNYHFPNTDQVLEYPIFMQQGGQYLPLKSQDNNIEYNDKIIFNTKGDKLLNFQISEAKNRYKDQKLKDWYKWYSDQGTTVDDFNNKYPSQESYELEKQQEQIKNRFNPDFTQNSYQMGGQPQYTPAQWNKLNMEKGLLASPGASINLSGNQNSRYLDFYDPNVFQPSTSDSGTTSQINWSKINDPNWKYTDQNNSPFVSYKPSPQTFNSQKKFVQPSDERTAVGFQPNYTTYKYKDGSTKYQDTKGNLYNNTDELQTYLESLSKMQMGGPMDKFISRYATKQLNSQAPQGESMDDFLTNKNNNFLGYIRSNVKKFIVEDELKNYKEGYAQMGAEVGNSNQSDFYSGPFGAYGNQQVPDYVNSFKQSNPYNPFGIQNNQTQSIDNFRRNSNIADVGMAGVQTTNHFFDIYHNRQQDLYNQSQMTIDKTSQLQYGNRGDYDINTGKLRPDQHTTPTYQMGGETKKYKRGGEYSVGDSDLSDILSQGYQFEIVD